MIMEVWPLVLKNGLAPTLRAATGGWVPKKAVEEFTKWWVSLVRRDYAFVPLRELSFRDWLFRMGPYARLIWNTVFMYGVDSDLYREYIKDVWNKYKGELLRLDPSITFERFLQMTKDYLSSFEP